MMKHGDALQIPLQRRPVPLIPINYQKRRIKDLKSFIKLLLVVLRARTALANNQKN